MVYSAVLDWPLWACQLTSTSYLSIARAERPLNVQVAVEPVATLGPAPDEPDLAEHPQVLGDLGLGHREVVHDRPDRLLAGHEHVEDLAAVHVGHRVEDV